MLRKLLLVVLLALASVAQAAVYSLPWGPKPQFVDANGAPMSGATLQTFVGSSTTPQVTYTDSTGGVANPTTITLNVRGETPNEVWLTGGVSYKFVLKDSGGSTVWTVDSVSGVNDVTSALDEWKAGPTPTFVSTTTFTLAGDQTVEFHKGRRLKTTNSGGTIYSTITASVFVASTTVTVANDSSVLDSGLSAVSYGIVRAANPSISPDMVARKGAAIASAATTDIWSIAGDYVHITGATGPITSLGTAPYAGAQRVLIFDSTPTITHNATTLQLPGGANIVAAAGDRAIVRADTTANMIVVDYVKAASIAATLAGVETLTNKTLTNPSIDTVTGAVVATQANMESASATNLVVPPGRQHFHPSASKGWAQFNGLTAGTNAPSIGYNVTSITRTGAGAYTVNWTTSFSSANYAVTFSSNATNTGGNPVFQITAIATGSLSFAVVKRADGTGDDASLISVIAFGDL